MSDSPRRSGKPRRPGPPSTPPPEGHPSVTLALWAAPWLRGAAAPDHVIEALAQWAPMHLAVAATESVAATTGLAWPQDTVGAGPVALLGMLRRLGDGLRLEVVLPVAGDRGAVARGTDFAATATEAGEGLVLHRGIEGTGACTGCIGLVPFRDSGDVLRWVAYDAGCRGVPSAPPAVGESRHALREAVRRATDLLGGQDRVGAAGAQAQRAVAAHIARAGLHVLPPATPQRDAETFHSATTVAAILRTAEAVAAGSPHSATATSARDASLRELAGAVRSARLAATAHAVAALQGSGPPPGTAGEAARARASRTERRH
ncbi:hypothetical protein [Tomitella gaofuii]|uniref:hypothetical protein n=1 Tax=Tomitella gaofuii TaxID=2760083 RepID=UPI0015FDE04F|nr:hypothetical protein [Tomitella gaofuii]